MIRDWFERLIGLAEGRAFQTGGWPMKSTPYRFLSAVEVTETEDANGLPILDQGGTIRISPVLKCSRDHGEHKKVGD